MQIDHLTQTVLALRNACQLSYRCLLSKSNKGNYLWMFNNFSNHKYLLTVKE